MSRRLPAVSLMVLFALIMVAHRPTATRAAPVPAPASVDAAVAPEGWVHVYHVVDGDTVDVEWDGGTARVRLYGINTPERGEACFQEATDQLTGFLWDKGRDGWVNLEYGPRHEDRYGRTLAYLWVSDDTGPALIDWWMAWVGVAHAWTADGQHVDYITAAEYDAYANGRGCLWAGTVPPPPSQPAAPSTSTAAPVQANCDPSYPDVCIPSPPPDLDCGDIPYRRFRVVGADPHRFDGDRDGIGCES